MDDRSHLDDRLLASLLGAVERNTPAAMTDEHPDEELLVLFAEGALSEDERLPVVSHLAGCAPCRCVVSGLLTEPALEPVSTAAPRQAPVAWLSVVLAVAACVIVAIGSLLFLPRGTAPETAEGNTSRKAQELLAAGEFDKVRELVADARQRGIQSPRLNNLDAQSRRHIPVEVALAYAGRMTDFGYDVGGIVPRDPLRQSNDEGLLSAYNLLLTTNARDFGVILNRGHALLSLGKPEEALREFQNAVAMSPGEPWGWLGQGVAEFMMGHFAAAETAFRECLDRDSHIRAARFNLAMALEEQEKFDEALAAWQGLLKEELPGLERAKVLQAIELLKQQP